MHGSNLTAAVFEPTTKYWQIGHKLPYMLNKGPFGLRKIFKNIQGAGLFWPVYQENL